MSASAELAPRRAVSTAGGDAAPGPERRTTQERDGHQCSPSDGKTLTAINLALILSESYQRRVLLMDADLRRPSIHDVSTMPNVMGLAEGLRAKTEQKLTVLRSRPNLSLLPAGRPDPDPMGGLTSSRMRAHPGRMRAAGSTGWSSTRRRSARCPTPASWRKWWMPRCWSCGPERHGNVRWRRRRSRPIGRDRILGVVLNAVEPLAADQHRTTPTTRVGIARAWAETSSGNEALAAIAGVRIRTFALILSRARADCSGSRGSPR